MKSINSSHILLSLSLLLSGCVSIKQQATVPDEVKILLDKTSDAPGILVEITSPVMASGPKRGEVQIMISNLLLEEVFVEVEGFDRLGFEIKTFDKDGYEVIELGGGGVTYGHSHFSLKRLRKSTIMNNGEKATCGCAVAFVKGKLDLEDADLMEWIGSDIIIEVPVRGFLRRNGKEFYEIVEIPAKIVKGQQNNAGSPD